MAAHKPQSDAEEWRGQSRVPPCGYGPPRRKKVCLARQAAPRDLPGEIKIGGREDVCASVPRGVLRAAVVGRARQTRLWAGACPQPRPNLSSAALPESGADRPPSQPGQPCAFSSDRGLRPTGRILGEWRGARPASSESASCFWNRRQGAAVSADNELLVISYAYLIMLAAKARSMTVKVQAAQSNTFNIVNLLQLV